MSERSRGVSVIVPTHGGRSSLDRCLTSLADQQLRSSSFEVIVLPNGEPKDAARWARAAAATAQQVMARRPGLSVRVISSGMPGAGRARNLGIAAARFSYVTFLDDDDWLSPAMLSTLLRLARPGRVAVGQVFDVSADGQIAVDGYADQDPLAFAGSRQQAAAAPRVFGYNAAKLIATDLAAQVGYDTQLRSGEDVVFFLTAAARRGLRVIFAGLADRAIYFRSITEDSVSRRTEDFSFAIEERLAVLGRLQRIREQAPTELEPVLDRHERAQLSMMRGYLRRHPNRLDQAQVAIMAGDSALAVQEFFAAAKG